MKVTSSPSLRLYERDKLFLHPRDIWEKAKGKKKRTLTRTHSQDDPDQDTMQVSCN